MNRESTRQRPHIHAIRDRARELPGYRATLLIGSFAAGTADDLSDIDVILALEEGAFDAAWQLRGCVRPADSVHHWDVRADATREVAVHNWFTRELVLVECVFVTPRGRMRLAEPFVVLDGGADIPDSFVRRGPIARSEVDEYNVELEAAGQLPQSHLRYGDFIRALRADRARSA